MLLVFYLFSLNNTTQDPPNCIGIAFANISTVAGIEPQLCGLESGPYRCHVACAAVDVFEFILFSLNKAH